MEDEVLDKHKVEDSKREAFRGRRKNKKYIIREWREDCWARIFALFRVNNLQRLQSKQGERGLADKEEVKQQQRMKTMG